jgi:hypothetical protein
MDEKNLAPWTRLPETEERLPLSDYCALAQLADAAATTQIDRTQSIDDPIASATIESLRLELENAQEMVNCLREELRKERGDSDDE